MADEEVGLVKALDALPPKPPTTTRFFRRGDDFYCVYGDDATFVARDFYKTMGVVKMLGPAAKQVASVALSRNMFETVVRDLLLVRQYRVELLENRGRGKNNEWVVVKKASPGNLMQLEDHIYSHAEVNQSSCMAVKVANDGGSRKIGVAVIDTTRFWIGVCEFVDNDQFSTFESVVVQQGAKECLMAEAVDSPDGQKLAHIAERSRMLVSPRRKGSFTTKDINQDLDRLLVLPAGTSAAALPETEMVHAMASAASLIDYLEILRDDANFGKFTLERFDGTQYMKLDAAAVRALNLVPTPGAGGPKTSSLVGVLDACQTSQGKRLLHQWVKQPLLDKARIEERLDVVSSFYDDAELRDSIRMDSLKRMPDLNRLAKKFLRDKGRLEDVVHVYDAVQLLPGLIRAIEDHSESGAEHSDVVNSVLGEPVRNSLAEFKNFEGLVEASIDLDGTEGHTYLIKETYNSKLGPLKEAMDAELEKLPRVSHDAARSLGLELDKAVKLERDDKNGYHLRVTRSNEKVLRKVRGIITLETQKKGVKFTTPALRDVNEEHRRLKSEYESEQQEVVDEVLRIVKGYCGPMELLNDRIAVVDVVASFAHVSVNAPVPYVRPTILPRGEGGIKLEAARHPCVEMQDDVAFIANDATFEHGKSNFSIITGPNMGGKSTYIRQIGVAVLMAQIGCFVPCDSATISIVDSILARVGAGDSQLKGVSTFMAEMLETASILKAATKDSLIIIDELGRGTSTCVCSQ